MPRKNLRPLLGIPLVAHTIKIALQSTSAERVVVITDDDEIEEVSRHFGAQVIRESESATGRATLDDLIIKHLPDLATLGATDSDLLITMQPTCPLITPDRVAEAVSELTTGAGAVISVKDDRHLTWGIENDKPVPLYKARVNRQELPAQFRESGAIIGARIADIKTFGTRIVEPIALVELPESQSLDIDTFADLVVAEHWLTRKRILLHADAGSKLGMGHVYRTLALAQELARHEILIMTTESMPLGKEFFERQVFSHQEIPGAEALASLAKEFAADLVVLDILDTELELVEGIRATGAKVVSFEDMGPGAAVADLVVSDLYPNQSLGANQLTSVENAVLAPSFESLSRKANIVKDVNHVLVLFGGTDPSGLALSSLRALEEIGFSGKVSCVRGLGASPIEGDFKLDLELLKDVKNMGALMASADLAMSSAGRTITELMSIGVPTICLAQNDKELSHTHASRANGVINLGLGSLIGQAELAEEIAGLIQDSALRIELNAAALAATAKRSNAAIVKRIFEFLGF